MSYCNVDVKWRGERNAMPFEAIHDLPKNVRDNLPEHAQRIYMKAFNNAWEQYKDPEKRYEGRTQEETAHAVAWSAVEDSFEKDSEGQWVEKKNEE